MADRNALAREAGAAEADMAAVTADRSASDMAAQLVEADRADQNVLVTEAESLMPGRIQVVLLKHQEARLTSLIRHIHIARGNQATRAIREVRGRRDISKPLFFNIV